MSRRYEIKKRFTFEGQGGANVVKNQISDNKTEFQGITIKVSTLILGYIITGIIGGTIGCILGWAAISVITH